MNILFVGANASPAANLEVGLIDRLENTLGHTVVFIEDTLIDIPTLEDSAYDSVIFSDNLSLSVTGLEIQAVGKPLLSLSRGVFLGFGPQGSGPTSTEVYVQDDQDPLVGGLPLGLNNISTVAYQQNRCSNVVNTARLPVSDAENDPNDAFVAWLDKGVVDTNGNTTPSVRGFYGIAKFQTSNATPAFWTIFDSIIGQMALALVDITGTLYSDEDGTVPYLAANIFWKALDASAQPYPDVTSGTVDTTTTNGVYTIDDPLLVAGRYYVLFFAPTGESLGSTFFEVQ